MNDEFELDIHGYCEQPAAHPEAATPETAIHLVVTDADKIDEALKTAARLSAGLNCRLVAVVPEVVPYSLPLNEPMVPVQFRARQVWEAFVSTGVDAEIRVVLCRDERQALRELLMPDSVVVIGGQRRWWPTRESRLAKWLLAAGYHVIHADQ